VCLWDGAIAIMVLFENTMIAIAFIMIIIDYDYDYIEN